MKDDPWLDAQRLEVGGSRFIAGVVPSWEVDDQFVIVKPPELIRQYLALLDEEKPRTIVELGVKEGGSTALIALAAKPDRLLAVDLAAEIPKRLAELIDAHDLSGSVVTAFGLDQGDRAALTAFIDENLPDGGFDLVIDDASHVLGPTRTSFEILFPRLRPGGLYVVEDWNSDWDAATYLARIHPEGAELTDRIGTVNQIFNALNSPDHGLSEEVLARINESAATAFLEDVDTAPRTFLESVAAAVDRTDRSVFAGLDHGDGGRWRPLADFAVELAMIRASKPDLVDEVTITGEWLTARRGSAELPLDDFRLDDCWTDFFGYLR